MDAATVAELMTDPVLTVGADESPGELAEAMVELGIKSVLVTDGDCHPEGIITSTDYLRMTADGVDPHATTVGEFMTDDVVTLGPGERVGTAATLMREEGINHLPVVDDAGEAVGIVSATDLTEHLAGGG